MSQDVGSIAPNSMLIRYVTPDNTLWHNIGSLSIDSAAFVRARSVKIRSIATGGVTDGSPFQILKNQASTPAGATTGQLISGAGQTIIDPAPMNIYVKASVAGDIIEAELIF